MDYTLLENNLRTHGRALRGYILKKCRNDEYAEEIYAEMCLRAVRFWYSFKGGNLKSWLIEIALNVMYEQARKRARYRRMFLEEGETPPVEVPALENTEELVLEREKAAEISAALCKVDDSQRVLLQDWLAGMSYLDIAAKRQLNVQTVKSRIHRAKEVIVNGRAAGSRKPTWFKQWLEEEKK